MHLGVDGAGFIVAETLTDANTDGANTGIDLIDDVPGDIDVIIGDAAYDTRPFYDAGKRRGASVVVLPIKTARIGRPRCPARDQTTRRVQEVGRREWKKEADYHRQGRAENAFFRYKAIFGDRMRARGADAQSVEARLACGMLNRMTDLGRPTSYAIES